MENDLILDNQIEHYEYYVKDIFNSCRILIGNQYGSDAIPFLTFHYFESVYKLKTGDISNNSEFSFYKGYLDVYPNIKQWGPDLAINTLRTWYKHGRCGLYHQSMLKNVFIFIDDIKTYKDLIGSENSIYAININKTDRRNPGIIICSPLFIDNLNTHFRSYITKLKVDENPELKENFKKVYDKMYNAEPLESIISLAKKKCRETKKPGDEEKYLNKFRELFLPRDIPLDEFIGYFSSS